MKKTEFASLEVKNITQTTEDCVVIEFIIPPGLENDFQYKQGQYLTIEKEILGEKIRRSYSLCSSPLEHAWKIGVKKVSDGRFSTFANDILRPGDYLEVMKPQGKFFVDINVNLSRNYVAFAAGSGITPILSIIKTHLFAEPHSTFKLFYSNKSVGSIILKEELEGLKNQFIDRLEIFYILTEQQRGIPLLNGRIDHEKLDIIFKAICEPYQIDHFFLCGPEDMINTVKDSLLSRGVENGKIHFELFRTDGEKIVKKKAELAVKYEGKVCKVLLTEGGKNMEFVMPLGGKTILEAGLSNAADLPFACKGGVCCTCRAKLLHGEVDMPVHYGLEQDEIDAGYILTCQALPVSENIEVNFDIT